MVWVYATPGRDTMATTTTDYVHRIVNVFTGVGHTVEVRPRLIITKCNLDAMRDARDYVRGYIPAGYRIAATTILRDHTGGPVVGWAYHMLSMAASDQQSRDVVHAYTKMRRAARRVADMRDDIARARSTLFHLLVDNTDAAMPTRYFDRVDDVIDRLDDLLSDINEEVTRAYKTIV